MTELQPVPSVEELAKTHPELAQAIQWNADKEPTRWHLTPSGAAYLGEIMAANARIRVANGEGDWVQPPTRSDLGGDQNAP